MLIVLYIIIIMKLFDNIEFYGFNHFPQCKASISKHFDGYYVLDCCSKGKIYLQVGDAKRIVLPAPVAWFTFPGPLFHFGPSGGEYWEHRYIAFRGKRVDTWLDQGLLDFDRQRPFVNLVDASRFISGMDEVMKKLEHPLYGLPRAVHMFEGLLLQLHEQHIVKPVVSVTDAKVAAFIKEIDQKPEARWNMKAASSKMGISYSHFRLIFRNLAGMPPHRYINTKRMVKAGRLLRENQLEIKQIAYRLGYDDLFHFSKLFKNHYQIPPGKFRERHFQS